MADQISGLLSPYLRRKRIEAVRPYLRGSILDFGCGTGMLSGFAEPGSYYGVDRDSESIDLARKLHPAATFDSVLPAAGSFDTITGLAVIEHLKDPKSVLLSLSKLLAADGSIVLTTPHPQSDYIHKAGAAFGLFSAIALEEHETLFNLTTMQKLAGECSLRVVHFNRFLFGINQLFVLKPAD